MQFTAYLAGWASLSRTRYHPPYASSSANMAAAHDCKALGSMIGDGRRVPRASFAGQPWAPSPRWGPSSNHGIVILLVACRACCGWLNLGQEDPSMSPDGPDASRTVEPTSFAALRAEQGGRRRRALSHAPEAALISVNWSRSAVIKDACPPPALSACASFTVRLYGLIWSARLRTAQHRDSIRVSTRPRNCPRAVCPAGNRLPAERRRLDAGPEVGITWTSH